MRLRFAGRSFTLPFLRSHELISHNLALSPRSAEMRIRATQVRLRTRRALSARRPRTPRISLAAPRTSGRTPGAARRVQGRAFASGTTSPSVAPRTAGTHIPVQSRRQTHSLVEDLALHPNTVVHPSDRWWYLMHRL